MLHPTSIPMPRRIFKRYLPDARTIREHPSLRFLGELLHDPGLWHLNRRSVSGAFAVGLFCMWVPIPLQMLLAALLAIVFRVNLPLSSALVWITNPLTMAPMFYAAHRLGAWMLDHQPVPLRFELSIDWLGNRLEQIWQPFLLGCGVFAVLSALLGFVLVRVFWRYHLIRRLQEKRLRHSLLSKRRRDAK